MTGVHGQLVQEHLCPFVGVGHLDARYEADGSAMRVGDQEVVNRVGKEPDYRVWPRWIVEKLTCVYDSLFITRSQDLDVQCLSGVRRPG